MKVNSTKINNVFTFGTILVMSVVMMIYSKYILPATQKNQLLPCQMKVKTIEDIIYPKEIIIAKAFLLKGDYNIYGDIKFENILEDDFDKNKIKKFFLRAIGVKKNINDGLVKIRFILYKYYKKKQFGYLFVKFYFKNKLIYQNKSYINNEKNIFNRIKCIIKGFLNVSVSK